MKLTIVRRELKYQLKTFHKIIKTLFQSLFILNVMVNDGMLACVTIIRGLGILNDTFLGVSEDGSLGSFCLLYPLANEVIVRLDLGILFLNIKNVRI